MNRQRGQLLDCRWSVGLLGGRHRCAWTGISQLKWCWVRFGFGLAVTVYTVLLKLEFDRRRLQAHGRPQRHAHVHLTTHVHAFMFQDHHRLPVPTQRYVSYA